MTTGAAHLNRPERTGFATPVGLVRLPAFIARRFAIGERDRPARFWCRNYLSGRRREHWQGGQPVLQCSLGSPKEPIRPREPISSASVRPEVWIPLLKFHASLYPWIEGDRLLVPEFRPVAAPSFRDVTSPTELAGGQVLPALFWTPAWACPFYAWGIYNGRRQK